MQRLLLPLIIHPIDFIYDSELISIFVLGPAMGVTKGTELERIKKTKVVKTQNPRMHSFDPFSSTAPSEEEFHSWNSYDVIDSPCSHWLSKSCFLRERSSFPPLS
ncbi:hypothetical protein ATANTOWER_026162 [Ataeniobius toweri]|uniref:Uncharacterized protein n=1 Tax=Ataeniobius toweri TaxID=208326 RepID=A0ABU7BS71_9TELE|nr:hypothetical protein [Ataeniobius toweri]